ncbi:MAG: hypothetical protein R6U43_00790 [Candidatus Krumholzibacteriales bacterium]
MKYHHIGLPAAGRMEEEKRLEHLKMYVRGNEDDPYGIEWIRFDEDAPYPELVRTVAHVAFEVENVREAIRGKKVIIEPNSPSPGVTVAFIEHNGAPVEFLEIDRDREK